MIIVTKPTSPISDVGILLGRQGENNARQIVFDLSWLIEEYGNGTAVLVHQRSKDSAPYICTATQDGSTLTWTLNNLDTAYDGWGQAELRWTVSDVLAKTLVYKTMVVRSITADSTIPDPYESWYDQMIEYIDEHGGGGGAVDSVNGKTGVVILNASDVHALPDSTTIPTKVSQLQNDSGFGTYSKPSGGIPKTDLTSGVQASLDKADSALQTAPVTSVNNKTGAVTLSASDVGAGTYSKPSGGIPSSDMTSSVQTSLGKADSAYQKPSGGIPSTDMSSAVQTSLGKADTALQTAPVTSVNTKTGAVTLGAGDLGYDDEETYTSGTVGKEITDLKGGLTKSQTDITKLDGEVSNNYFIPPIAGNGNINRTDGTVDTNANYTYSDYVDISGYDKLTTDATQGSAFNAFYDSSKTFISPFSVTAGSGQTIAIPSNAVYMRVSNTNATYAHTFIFRGLCRDNVGKINGLKNEISVLADQTLFIPLIVGTGYVAVNDASIDDGDIVPSDTYSHSDYIDISDYDKLTVEGAVYNSAFNAFYDSSKEFVSSFSVATGNSTISIPSSAVYMRVSASTVKFNDTFKFKSLGSSNSDRISAVEEVIENQNTEYFTPAIASTGYISNNDGSEQVNANYSRSDYVDISRYGKLLTVASYESAFNAFYNSSKTFISAFTVRTGTDKVIEIPTNAVYMRVSSNTTKYADTFKFRPLTYVNAVLIDELGDEVDTLADAIANRNDTFSPQSNGTGNVSRDNGTIVSSSYLHSDYIDISQFPKLLTVASYDSAFNAFYDANKTFIAPFSIAAGTDKIIEIPDGAMYMRLSQSSSKYADTMHFRTLEYVTSDALPGYWFGHIANKTDAVRGHMNAIGKNGDTFVFITDIHWYSNQQMSPKLIRYLLNHLNINMVALGGDLITQGTKDEEITESWKCVEAFKFVDTFVPIDFGNHDNNSNQEESSYRFDANTVYSLFMKGFEDSVTWMTNTEFSFYFDKVANKTRYIFLDMGDDGVSKAFTAFAEFRDALKNTPSGYNVIIFAHIIDYGTFTTSLSQMIDAYNARTTVTVNSVVCDFTSVTGTGKIVICLGGHRHYDDETATSGGVPITVTDCDAMTTAYSKTAGTITEQSFDVVSLDYTNNIAYYERVGRNKSRIVHLTPVSASTTLTTSLTGTITWSSGDTSIATVSNGTITRLTTGTVVIKASNSTTAEVWVCTT